MPRIHLAIDNCFAAKRWTEPSEWARIVADLGVRLVEASADTENDPLYHGRDYQARWSDRVHLACAEHDVEVANLYSGHGTYSTLGLGHTDAQAADRMVDEWLKPQIDVAASFDAGIGFFTHAFPMAVLDDPETYARAYEALVGRLAAVTRYAGETLSKPAGVEQMYSPHQIPFTRDGARQLLADVADRAGSSLYLTLDVGHQSGQARFRAPERETLDTAVDAYRRGDWSRLPWLGAAGANTIARRAARDELSTEDAWSELSAYAEARPYLYANESDGDPYGWLAELGRSSPIVHLQQTDGTSSHHLPFTATTNQTGIVDPPAVLRALAEGFRNVHDAVTPAVEDIYLTLEIFVGTAANPFAAVEEIAESVAYWRRWIPDDGLALEDLVRRTEEKV
ncbi:MAG: TIM barrel protein [Spirochaetota bacterium]